MRQLAKAIYSSALALILLSIFALTPANQVDDILVKGIQQMTSAYNLWEADSWQAVVTTFEQAVKQAPDYAASHYWAGVGYYYQAAFYLHARDKDKDDRAGKRAIAQGIKTLKTVIQLNPNDSESYALLGVLQGMQIKMNIWSAPGNGPLVEKNRELALELNEDNPRVHYLTGISLFMTPELFGGSDDMALEHMLKAITLFEKERSQQAEPLAPRWGYHDCLAFIGDIYLKKKDVKQAYRYYQRALNVNPNDLKATEGLERINQKGE